MDNRELADGEDSSKSPACFVKKNAEQILTHGDENKMLDILCSKKHKSQPQKNRVLYFETGSRLKH
jgi:hypothetical protein